MSDAVIASGVVAVAVFGFAPQNNAMLAAGARHMVRPVIDGMVASVCGWLIVFGLALATLSLLPSWTTGLAMLLASLYLALAGLSRYLSEPQPTRPAPAISLLPLQPLRSPDSWAVAVFLAGSALSGSMTLAAAVAGLILLTTIGLALWAAAGWTGCQHLRSRWQRRHLDWGFGFLMFVAAMVSLLPAG